MHLWISHIRNLESFAENHQRLLDAWEAGGVTGLVIGTMQLNMREMMSHSRQTVAHPHSGETRDAFAPDPAIYADLGATAPPGPPPGDEKVQERIRTALTAVVDRGWELWVFDPLTGAVAPGADSVAARMCDAEARTNLAARMLDTVAAYPMATGIIIDGPAWGFEITEIPMRKMARRRLIFDELTEQEHGYVEAYGFDFPRLLAAKEQLWRNLHDLTDEDVAALPVDDPGAAWQRLGGPGMPEWIDFRVAALTSLYRHLTETLHSRVSRDVKFAVCPRQPAFARLAGYDFDTVAGLVDVVMPKLYFWQRGYDGTIGVAHRWAETLLSWNPGLSVKSATMVARAVFGPTMPVVSDLIEFDHLLTPAHAGSLAARDLDHIQTAAGNRARIVPWIDTGRAPHDGDPLTAAHLDAILSACEQAGLEHVNFFNSTNLTEADWTMLSHHCGTRWSLTTSDYLPDDRPTV